MIELMKQAVDFLSVELTVMLTAALPILEVKAAIPFGVYTLGLTPWHATILSFFGSIVPVPFILFGIRPVFNFLKHTKMFEELIHKITRKTIHKTGHKVQKYGAWALFVFVAIPLPGTGVWTGSLAAALLDIRFKWAFPAIVLGNAVATFLIATLTLGVLQIVP